MRRYFLASLLFSLLAPVKANETCLFVSQYEPDLSIEVSTKHASKTNGFIKYKDSPAFQFSTGIRNGYRGQYFSINTISNSVDYKERNIVSGSVLTVIGDQSGTGTPKKVRKQGLNKIFFPNFGLNYYYFLLEQGTKLDDFFNSNSVKIYSILNAAEGFWIPSEICKKYVPYGW